MVCKIEKKFLNITLFIKILQRIWIKLTYTILYIQLYLFLIYLRILLIIFSLSLCFLLLRYWTQIYCWFRQLFFVFRYFIFLFGFFGLFIFIIFLFFFHLLFYFYLFFRFLFFHFLCSIHSYLLQTLNLICCDCLIFIKLIFLF